MFYLTSRDAKRNVVRHGGGGAAIGISLFLLIGILIRNIILETKVMAQTAV